MRIVPLFLSLKITDPRLTAQAGTLTLLGTYAVDFASKKR